MGSIDSDAHVIECEATFDYMDPEFEHLRPMVVIQKTGSAEIDLEGRVQTEYWIIDGKLQPKEGNIGSNTSKESREMINVQARLDHMDQLEIDVQVLYPTVFLRAWTQNPEIELALCRSYNRWLADIWSKAPDRLRWVVMPPLLQMDKVRGELEFAKKNGACGVFMRGLECERRVATPYFHPLFDIAAELDLPICFHSGNNSFNVRDIYAKECGFGRSKLPVVSAFHNLLMDDIPAKWPTVRWGFVEVSAQWIPYALNDMEIRFGRRGREFPENIMAQNNIYVACQVTDDLDWVLKYSGDETLIIGTDYGHADTSAEIEALRKLKNDGKVSAIAADKILNDNAKVFYGL